MVKYLNNRGRRSARRQQDNNINQTNWDQNANNSAGQDAGAQNDQQSGQQNGAGVMNALKGQKTMTAQDHPAKAGLATFMQLAKNFLIYQPKEVDDRFSLGGRRTGANAGKPAPGQHQDWLQQDQKQNGGTAQDSGNNNQTGQQPAQQSTNAKNQSTANPEKNARGNVIPTPPGTGPYFQQQAGKNAPQQPVEHTQQGGTPPGQTPVPIEEQIHFELAKNLAHIKRVMHLPDNKGFTIREFKVGFEPPVHAFILFTDGLADKNVIDNFLLEPLMVLGGLEDYHPEDPLEMVKQRLVTTNQVEEKRSFREVIDGVLTGSTAIFVEGVNSALLVETKGWEHRPIGRPIVENVVRGPQEGFNEVLISNIALVRSRLRTENLVSEMYKVGTLSKADVSIMYLRDIANPAVINEVRKRLQSLNVDYVPDTGMLEQLIEDDPMSLMPQTLTTERPDRVAAYLAEGHVALIMSSTPFALIVPATFWSLLHSPEDFYVRWPYGGLMRMVRVLALLIGMFLPAFYIAIVNYHHAMVPQDLLFAIAASREQVPFPAVVEIIIMEISFELIREAGIRIPSIIGPTIGIVGALILGQAAVQANLITPIVIIIVALTGLSSFAIPNYNLSFQVRLIRFMYIFLAAVGGFVTMSAGMVIHMAVLSSTMSFGAPILAPASPNRPSKDTVFRGPLWAQEERPNLVRPLERRRQSAVSRPWDPEARRKRGE